MDSRSSRFEKMESGLNIRPGGSSDGVVDWQARLREIADRVAAEQP